jgi:molybdopterin adenylyltransferase
MVRGNSWPAKKKDEMTINVGILTVSDRSAKGERADLSGSALAEIANHQGWSLAAKSIVPDDIDRISAILIEWVDVRKVDLILTTGGTGFTARDVTPEATRLVIQRETPGLTEAMRSQGMKKNPHAILSRAVAGIRQKTLIVNLPGSPGGASESLEVILPVIPHAIQLLQNNPDSEIGHHSLEPKP